MVWWIDNAVFRRPIVICLVVEGGKVRDYSLGAIHAGRGSEADKNVNGPFDATSIPSQPVACLWWWWWKVEGGRWKVEGI
eukprot:COSAG02_NODE_43217_length_377_cov_0.557554_1_plen_79_part_01